MSGTVIAVADGVATLRLDVSHEGRSVLGRVEVEVSNPQETA